MTNNCPCGIGKLYIDCCGCFIEGNEKPNTPEELMRSRYTAYTKGNVEYILRTMKAPASNHFDKEKARKWAKEVKWLKLEVKKTSTNDLKGFVEFIAYYQEQEKESFIHELSEFDKINGEWFYVDGKHTFSKPSSNQPLKIGRNELCSCGSGKKYKKCCL